MNNQKRQILHQTHTEPKVEINRKESTMRSIKGNHSYIDGAFIVESTILKFFDIKGKQPNSCFCTDAESFSIGFRLHQIN
jgi:hypothetical protein